MGCNSTCLVVEYKNSQERFEVRLCYDIMGLSVIYTGRIRFLLCHEDIEAIKTLYLNLFDPQSIERINIARGSLERRTHALLGQDILNEFSMLKHGHVELYVNPREYILPANFDELRNHIKLLEMQLKPDLPESFNDWEDDDFAFEDDDILSSEDFE